MNCSGKTESLISPFVSTQQPIMTTSTHRPHPTTWSLTYPARRCLPHESQSRFHKRFIVEMQGRWSDKMDKPHLEERLPGASPRTLQLTCMSTHAHLFIIPLTVLAHTFSEILVGWAIFPPVWASASFFLYLFPCCFPLITYSVKSLCQMSNAN